MSTEKLNRFTKKAAIVFAIVATGLSTPVFAQNSDIQQSTNITQQYQGMSGQVHDTNHIIDLDQASTWAIPSIVQRFSGDECQRILAGLANPDGSGSVRLYPDSQEFTWYLDGEVTTEVISDVIVWSSDRSIVIGDRVLDIFENPECFPEAVMQSILERALYEIEGDTDIGRAIDARLQDALIEAVINGDEQFEQTIYNFLEGNFVTRVEFVTSQAQQDARIDDLEARVSALEVSVTTTVTPAPVAGTTTVVHPSGPPVWLNFTGPNGLEFGPSNPYRGGPISANAGINAGVNDWTLVSVDMPSGGNRANDGLEHRQRSFYYGSLSSGSATISITVRAPDGTTHTVSHTLGY